MQIVDSHTRQTKASRSEQRCLPKIQKFDSPFSRRQRLVVLDKSEVRRVHRFRFALEKTQLTFRTLQRGSVPSKREE
jgi:hypothetical protein